MSASSTMDSSNSKPLSDKDPLLVVDNVSKMFGNFTAVDNVSLNIYPGEIFCLLGGSGCGKSTLLRIFAGFEEPTHGKILIDGEDYAGIPPHNRPTNMMFQSYALFPHMSVLKNVMFGLLHEGIKKVEAEKQAKEMLDLVQLNQFTHRKPHQLSGGQRQRVALARALVKKPKLLLLDEPLGALDKKLRTETQFELISIQETLGVTFIVVTHDQEEAMTLGTRIGVMNEGVIMQIGEPREVYEFPNSRFVADFIGETNIFEGSVIENEADHLVLKSDELDGIEVGHGVNCTLGQTLWVSVRPEKLEISKRHTKKMVNSIEGIVEDIAYLGNQSIYHVRLKSGHIVKAMRANRIREASDDITWEDKVFVGWDKTSGGVLDR